MKLSSGAAGDQFEEILETVRQLSPDRPLYLTGGAVRDRLLQRACHDLDFSLPGDPSALARQAANTLNGAYYLMDDERGTARVVIYPGSSQQIFLDFASFRGASLEEDLRHRDFTVNAIALDLPGGYKLVDPLNGLADVSARLLRLCSPTAMQDDPVRILRGVRQSLSLSFHLLPETWRAMKNSVSLLPKISAERLRDELFNMLEGGHVASAMRLLDQAGTLPLLLPEVTALKNEIQSPPHVYDIWEHSLAQVMELDRLFTALVGSYPEDAGANLATGLAVLRLGRFRQNLEEHFNTHLNPNRSLRSLLFLGALLHDAAKPASRQVEDGGRMRFTGHDDAGKSLAVQRGQALALSQVEIQRLETLVGEHMRIHSLAKTNQTIARRAIYRFFRSTGPCGVDLCLLSLADTLATYGVTLPNDLWVAELDTCRALLEAWWEQREEVIAPPRLVNGNDLISILHLKPGPQIGALLAAIQENQATGDIVTREQALEFANAWLEKVTPA